MTKQPKTFIPQEKSQVALAATKGEKTLAQIGFGYTKGVRYLFSPAE